MTRSPEEQGREQVCGSSPDSGRLREWMQTDGKNPRTSASTLLQTVPCNQQCHPRQKPSSPGHSTHFLSLPLKLQTEQLSSVFTACTCTGNHWLDPPRRQLEGP